MDTTHGIDLAPLAAVRRASGAAGTAEAARVLAASAVPVFPCVQGSTRPLSRVGSRSASTDPDRVTWWWSRYPTTNLAIPTGASSGLDVLEVQTGRGVRSGFDALRQAMRAGRAPRPGLVVATPSGGLHLFFPRSPEAGQRSWSAPWSALQFHGDRGYVVLPPSLIQQPDGAVTRYRLIGSATTPTAPVDAIALRHFVDSSSELLATPAQLPFVPASTVARPMRVATPISAVRPAAPGARSRSRPDSGGPGRRPPEVVSL
jgi:hypothetical protein